MNTTLTREQIEQYQRDGVLIYRELLSESEVDELLASVSEGVSQLGGSRVAKNEEYDKDHTKGDDYYDNVFLQRVNLWKLSDKIRSMFAGSELGKMVSTLAGVDGVRVWHDQTLQKLPWANPTAWHLDNPYWSFHSRNAISIWIALDDATPENGCLYYLPGTHKTAEFDRNVPIGPNVGKLLKAYPEWQEIRPIVGAMKRGDCGFHNGLTAHGAGANMTPGYRRAMTCAYMPVGSVFNGKKNILPTEYFDRLSVGDVLDSDELNPLAWQL